MMFVFGVAAAHELQLVVSVGVDLVGRVVARGDMGPKATSHVDDFWRRGLLAFGLGGLDSFAGKGEEGRGCKEKGRECREKGRGR